MNIRHYRNYGLSARDFTAKLKKVYDLKKVIKRNLEIAGATNEDIPTHERVKL